MNTTEKSQEYWNLVFGKDLAEVDPDVADLIAFEEERQARKLIMIPSESYCPKPVREALGSVFNNIYAEGYPRLQMTQDEEELLLQFDHELAHYRRYADRRFYKGVDYVDLMECLAQRRVAACFANERVNADEIYVNVQPLSGSPANLSVYEALLEPGDTIMGLALPQGGHLTHGSPFNISGRRYNVVSYAASRATEKLDYDEIMELALEHKPKLIVAGYTSYSWAPDWEKFKEIADAVGGWLMADVAHTAGLAIAGVYPNPVGIADITTFTTHKTLFGPRGAVIMTTDEDLATLIDNAVFPGRQGGPHVHKFAAIAVAAKIAQSGEFKRLQHRIVDNCVALADGLQKRGLKLAYGGTDTHLLVIDLNPLKSPEGFPLKGEMAARILDLAGIVVNKNTIPGDEDAGEASGIRMGTPWLTQRGMGEAEMDKIADLIHRIVVNIKPFTYMGLTGPLWRGKIDLDILEEVKLEVEELARGAEVETPAQGIGYPHYYFLRETSNVKREASDMRLLEVYGQRATSFLQQVSTNDVSSLQPGDSQQSFLLDAMGQLIDSIAVLRLEPDRWGRDNYIVRTNPENTDRVKAWFRGLGDGYIIFDENDIFRKVEGPVVVKDLDEDAVSNIQYPISDLQPFDWAQGRPATGLSLYQAGHDSLFHVSKPYFVGQKSLESVRPKVEKKEWRWDDEEGELKRTCLYEEHLKLTQKVIPFAGWEMPVWYTSVGEEHKAVRETAGLFDVAHMGVLEVAGEHATAFLDVVTSNYVRWIGDGQSQYAYLLDPDGNVIDDIMVYRRAADRYMLVVNASNAEKDLAWLNAVNSGKYLIDREHPDIEIEGPAIIRDLKDPSSGEDQRVDLAIQGPNSLAILQSLTEDAGLRAELARIRRTDFIETELSGVDLIVSRTGYTGEDIAYELYLHPDNAAKMWNLLLEKGPDYGLKPTGLAARDSTRTEAGLPLHGHDLAGPYNISPIEAGFGPYVKFHKPYFIGRKALLEKEATRKMEILRFRMDEKGVRMARLGDPVVDKRGKYIGRVTSCALDTEGFQVGLAYVDGKYNREGVQIGIIPLPYRRVPPARPVEELKLGDKMLLHEKATVLTRFPEEEEPKPRTPQE
jgi:glycine hydroxymethyltransferase